MKESDFIEKNIESWQRLESLIAHDHSDPDELQSLFVKISGDLSYARTFYPNRIVKNYLNDLLKSIFDQLPKEKNQPLWNMVSFYYRHTLPTQIITHHRVFLLAFGIFFLAVMIGIFSNIEDIEFLRSILGDSYVDMTEANIASGDPMAVYKQEEETSMFLSISIHNIQVSFFAFVLGMLGGIGTVYILLYNGVMLGAFQAFFYQKGLFLTSFLTIWIHGTIEISSIIIAGAAGMVMGNGLLFPRSYSRLESIKKSSTDGLVIILSIIPLLAIAGFLEGFITRLTDLPTFIKLGIIMFSLLFILAIYVIYPLMYFRSGDYHKYLNDESIMAYQNKVERLKPAHIVERALSLYSGFFSGGIKIIALPILVVSIAFLYIFIRGSFILSSDAIDYIPSIYDFLFHPIGIIITSIMLMYFIAGSSLVFKKKDISVKTVYDLIRGKLGLIVLLMLFLWGVIALSYWSFFAVLVIIPLAGISRSILNVSDEGFQDLAHVIEDIKLSFRHYIYLGWSVMGCGLIMYLTFELMDSQLVSIVHDVLNAHHIIDDLNIQRFFYNVIIQLLVLIPMIFFWMILFTLNLDILETQSEASDLRQKFDLFTTRKDSV